MNDINMIKYNRLDFDENGNRKAKDQINKEIIDTNNILLEWVNSL